MLGGCKEIEIEGSKSNKQKENYVISKQENPQGSSKLIKWIDCDECHDWAHLSCTKKEEDEWSNIQKLLPISKMEFELLFCFFNFFVFLLLHRAPS